ncbi:MAG: Flp pilus assembly complex ATPase component TadA [Pseudomonadota bacterium]|nr:Flp pilus assembly complex ATPase component TadA [Pseudomonadota bacterium]
MSLRDWVQIGRKSGASDLHVEGGSPLVVRVGGELRSVGDPIAGAQVVQTGKETLGTEAWAQFMERGSADVSVVLGGTRCRINMYRTIRGLAFAVRLLAPSVHDLRTCNLHPDLRSLLEPTSGLVVISGPTGCGKSTTLAALIEELNAARARHIITLESPLEYVFTNRRSFIQQREIPTHSPSFEQAIIDSLRENPDVLVISEMRTPEVIRLTLNAAETGHLVLATMHSATCAESLSRICMAFPPDLQSNIRAQLADCLVGVVCQRLEFLETHQMRVPRCEILLASTGAKGAIRSGQFSQIANVIQSGGEDGMWTFDRYQRWMEQQRDWTRAPPPSAVPPDPPPPSSPLKAPPKPAVKPSRPQASAIPAENAPIEISIDEDVDLSELAKRIEQRTR